MCVAVYIIKYIEYAVMLNYEYKIYEFIKTMTWFWNAQIN